MVCILTVVKNKDADDYFDIYTYFVLTNLYWAFNVKFTISDKDKNR